MTREEAIEVYNGLINEKIKEAFEFFAPELRESEDERIRKFLVEMVKANIEVLERVKEEHDHWPNKGTAKKELKKWKSALAWLEKKKEQKPAWSEDIIRKAIKEVGLTQHQIDWFKTNVFPPKQEWSEEDEDMLNSCISSIEEAKENRYAYKETDGDTSYDREIAWLKSLRPSWKPSKEQIQAIKYIVSSIPPNYLKEQKYTMGLVCEVISNFEKL